LHEARVRVGGGDVVQRTPLPRSVPPPSQGQSTPGELETVREPVSMCLFDVPMP
jgi:hypothetical protein